jgi:hypothetical protein
VVFVADSQMNRLADNIQSFRALHQHLKELGIDPNQVPCVVQFNKRDLKGIAPVPLLKRYFAPNGSPAFESIATQGMGVFDTLKATIGQVVSQVQRKI